MSLPGFVLGMFDRLLSGETRTERARRRVLADRKAAPTGIRSLETLARKTGMDAQTCRATRARMGCEGVTMADGREGWRRAKDPT